MAENLGSDITSKEFRLNTSSNHIHVLLELSAEDSPFFNEFLNLFANKDKSKKSKDEYHNLSKSRQLTLQNKTINLRAIESSSEGKILLKDIQCCKPNDKGIVSKLSFPSNIDKMLILISVGDVHDLWVPSGSLKKFQTDAKAHLAAEMNLLTVNTVRQGMESIVFKETFVAETHSYFKNTRVATTASGSSIPVRPVSNEVERMRSSNFGTLKMLSQRSGDVSRDGLLMSLATDDTAYLRVWRVAGASRTLEPVSAMFILSSSNGYCLVLSSKNGVKVVCYLWIGQHSSPATRAALSLQTPALLLQPQYAKAACDQLMVEQGREPALLLAAVQRLGGGPLSILDDSVPVAPAGSDPLLRLEAVSSGIGLQGECCLLLHRLSPPAVQRGAVLELSLLPDGRLQALVSHSEGSATAAAALSAASLAPHYLSLLYPDRSDWPQPQLQLLILPAEKRDPSPRPRRLFLVSHTRRRVGRCSSRRSAAATRTYKRTLGRASASCWTAEKGCSSGVVNTRATRAARWQSEWPAGTAPRSHQKTGQCMSVPAANRTSLCDSSDTGRRSRFLWRR